MLMGFSFSCAITKVGEEAVETARFVTLFDKFFDMLNVSIFTNGTIKLKPFNNHTKNHMIFISR